MSKNVSSFICKLDKLNDERVPVFIPSLKKKITVRPLNLKQQKDLISSVLDGIRGQLDFTKTINKIIIENSGLTDLKIYDKLPFTINLRKEALGNIVNVEQETVELQRILNNLENIPFKLKPERSVKYKNLKINLEVPTLSQENTILSNCEQHLETESDTLKNDVGQLYIFEIVKYIKSVEMDDESVDMSEIRISERIKLIESLPLAAYKQIAKFMQDIDNYQNDVLTVDDYELAVDPLFFDNSSVN